MFAPLTETGRPPAPIAPFASIELDSYLDPPTGWYPIVRRAAEFLIVLVMAILAMPVVIIGAALVQITSPGPWYFTQTRLGKNGRRFTIYKLRSMYFECERYSGACWCGKGDSRITPVGRFLRRTHIDELPQLWNILRGDMSLIGPRPERPEFLPELESAIPRYKERLLVRPGVTGLAQVQLPPDSDVSDVRRKLAYDLYYISTMNPLLDLKILLCTPLKICCVPYTLLRKIFLMPTESAVMRLYRGSTPDFDLSDINAIPQAQPA